MIKHKRPRFGSDIGATSLHPFSVTVDVEALHYKINIKSILEAPEEMIYAIEVLEQANEKDTVTIHLSTGGGSIDSVDSLILAMAKCKGHIHIVGSGTIASAGTFVLLSGDTIELSPYTSILFHSASFGTYGEVQDVIEYTQFVQKQTNKLVYDYYKPLFSEEELHDMLVNKRQIWMDAEEFTERYEKALQTIEAEVKAEIAAMSDKGCSSPKQEPESLYTYEELIKMPTKKAMLEALGITPE
jgi:ATP-dependent protease ClpP protease subunit